MVLEGRNGSRVAFDVARTKLKSGSETRGGGKNERKYDELKER